MCPRTGCHTNERKDSWNLFGLTVIFCEYNVNLPLWFFNQTPELGGEKLLQ